MTTTIIRAHKRRLVPTRQQERHFVQAQGVQESRIRKGKGKAAVFAFPVFFAHAVDGRPPSSQGRRHTVKITKLVNLRVVLA